MPNRQELPSKLAKAHQQLQKAQSRVAELEAQLYLSEELAQHVTTLEQKVAERTADLQASLVRVEAILNNSPDGILLAHADLSIQQANSSFNTLLGSEWDAYFGQSLLTLLHPDDANSASDLLRTAANQPDEKRIEVRIVRKDGTTFDAELSIGVIKGDGLVCIIRDIIERKAQERQLRYHAALQENVHDAVIATDMEFRIQSWNKAAERTYGWMAEEALGKVAQELLQIRFPPIADRETSLKEFNKEGSLQQETIQRRKDGTDIFILGSATRLEDEKGTPIGVIAVNRDITERKAQERELRYYASIQESVNDAVIATDMDFKIQSWNHAAETIYGWSAAETIGRPVDEILQTIYETEGDRERMLHDFLERGAWQGEVIQHHRDGSPINILISANLFKDDLGQPFGVVSVNRDITELKQAQRAVIEKETHYRLLAENVSDVIAKVSPDGIRTYITPSCFALLGYTPDELIGKPSIELVHPDDGPNSRAIVVDTINTSNSEALVTQRVQHKAGHYLWVEVKVSILRDPTTGSVLEVIMVMRDITERKNAEAELRKAEQRYHALFEQEHDAVFLLDMQGSHLESNYRAVEMLGYSIKELQTLSFRELSDDLSQSETVLGRLLAGEMVPMYECVFRKKDGSRIPVEINVEIVRDLDGNPLHIQSVVRDITERKHAEESLRESEDRFRRAILDAPFPIMIHAEGGEVLHISNAWTEISGYTHSDIPTMTDWVEKAYRENSQTIRPVIEKVYALTEARRGGEFRLWTKSGEERIWEFISAPLALLPDSRRMVSSMAMDITERKRAEEVLRQSEEHFALVFRFSPVAIGLTTAAEGRYLDVNDSLLKLLGYSRDEMIGRTASELNVWATPEEREVVVQTISEKGSVRGLEVRFRQKTGEICTTLTSIVPVMLNGQSCLLSIVQDITERKAAEETLNAKAEEERQFQSHLKALHEIILELTTIDELSAFYKRTVELGRERLGFERLAMFLYDEQSGNAIGTFGTDTQGNITDERGVRFKPDPNGIMQRSFERAERFYFNEQSTLYNDEQPVGSGWNAAAVLWNGTQSLGWFVADNLLSHAPASKPLLDIIGLYALSIGTLLAQKQTQIALRESEALYRLLAENLNDLIMRSTLTSECLYISPSVQSILGYTPEELIGQQTFDLIHPDDKAPIRQAYAEVLERNDLIMPHQYRAKRKDGHYIWLETVGKPLVRDETKEVYGVITSSRDITERKQAEDALRESEEKFRLLLDAAPVATIISDQSGRINLVNVQAETLFGYGRSELTGKMVEILVPDYARDRHGHNRTTYIAAPCVRPMGLGMELFARHKDGSDVPVEIQLSYIETRNGIMVMSFILDITERKRNAAELEQQRSFLRNVIDVSPSMIFVKDYDAHFVLANPLVAKMYNTTVEDIIGKTDADFNPSTQEVTNFLEADRHVIISGETFFIEEPITNSTGKTHWLQTTKVPIVSADGKSKYVLGVSTDITERKEAEEALRESEEKFRLFVESAPTATLISDKLGNIILLNQQAEKLFGYDRNELLGKSIDELVPEELRKAHIDHRSQYLSGAIERRTHGVEASALHKDGRVFPAEVQLNYVDLSDEPIVISSVIDVTSRKQAEETLRQALAKEKELGDLKTRFVSMASHEFRTPLATILAATDTLSAYRHKLTEEQIEQRFDKIKDQVGHLKDIMEDVLMLARMQARRVEFNPVKLDLDALARSVLDEFESRPDVRHTLEYTVGEGIHEVLLDRKLMRQIINNLVSNAIKYSPEGKGLRINLENTDSAVILKISDEGIGIPEADLPHLFEPFHRAANVGTISGTGLGLVITREAVDLHGGTIAVESQQGVGTTFIIRIPISTGGER